MPEPRKRRVGRWRQAVCGFCCVLPVSPLLNYAAVRVTGGWPELLTVIVHTTVRVAALTWFSSPLARKITRGWVIASPRRTEHVGVETEAT
ncbi:hypothetical protein NUM3379_22890 [Kineococcus sp. NUM-3379]